jgi:hypothetical protein
MIVFRKTFEPFLVSNKMADITIRRRSLDEFLCLIYLNIVTHSRELTFDVQLSALFGLTISWTRGGDSKVQEFELTLLGFSFSFELYQYDHWEKE